MRVEPRRIEIGGRMYISTEELADRLGLAGQRFGDGKKTAYCRRL
jgi:hypothetical protein